MVIIFAPEKPATSKKHVALHTHTQQNDVVDFSHTQTHIYHTTCPTECNDSAVGVACRLVGRPPGGVLHVHRGRNAVTSLFSASLTPPAPVPDRRRAPPL